MWVGTQILKIEETKFQKVTYLMCHAILFCHHFWSSFTPWFLKWISVSRGVGETVLGLFSLANYWEVKLWNNHRKALHVSKYTFPLECTWTWRKRTRELTLTPRIFWTPYFPPRYGIGMFLADMGGVYGFALGISVITLLEFLDWILLKVGIRFNCYARLWFLCNTVDMS